MVAPADRAEFQAFGTHPRFEVGHVENRHPVSAADKLTAQRAKWI
jgi:hypothetical protein